MTKAVDQGQRYDRVAQEYATWWAPALAPSALALLARVDGFVGRGADPGRPFEVLDIGSGTGTLALGAVERWPDARVVGIDASGEMLATAERFADTRLAPADRGRLSTRTAVADDLPLETASIDLAISSFVFQLVPDRPRVLREVRRVLRPGGTLAYVTWLAGGGPFAPDRVFDTLLDEYGFEDEVGDDRNGDLPSVGAAADELRDARFEDVSAEAGRLEHAFTADSYLRFLTDFDEVSLFEDMARAERRRFLMTLRERLMALTPDELTFRAPIVYASGRRG